MRFMVMVKQNEESEAGKLPSRELMAKMAKFNDDLVKAGVLLSGEGLMPSSKGAKVRFEGKKRTVIDGPFSEAKELIGGFWIWQVKDRDEAIEWAKRIPFEGNGEEVEIRKIGEPEDYAPEATPKMVEKEKKLFAELEKKRKDAKKSK